MASTGDDGSDMDSLDRSPSLDSSVNAGAESNTVDAEEVHRDSFKAALADRTHPGSENESRDEQFGGSEEEERENRFQGPSSTWRFFTEEERGLAQSLDEQRANDLSLHLYNVHALKARLRDPDAAEVEHYRSKKRWIKPDANGDLPWQPPDRWTAWPLPTNQVPRSREQFGVSVVPNWLEDATYRKAESWKPSGELREEILAVALRSAKERLSGHREKNGDTVAVADDETPPPRYAQMSGALPADVDVSIADDGDVPVDFVPDNRRGTAKAKTLAAFVLDENILLDDDEARTLLQPKMNNILSQLDGLLIGLHKSRQGQVRTNSRLQSRSGRSRSTSRPATSTTRSKSKRRDTQYEQEHEQSAADAKHPGEDEHSSGDQPKRRRKLNPRDWSEVIGMAAFTGCDPKVVDRAAKRCSALFGEGMNFKTVPLNSIKSIKSKTRTTTATVHSERDVAPASDGFIVDDTSKSNHHVCPVENCARHNVPFDKAWRWREHLKRSHKYSNARVQRLEAELNKGTNPAANISRITSDPVLRPVDVRMARGKDAQPRKRRAPRSEAVLIQDDDHADTNKVDQPMLIASGSDSDDEDTDMDE
jgi:hypothetical protein